MYHYYTRMVVQTGNTSEERYPIYMTQAEFYQLLNQWNSQQPTTWHYWQAAKQRDKAER